MKEGTDVTIVAWGAMIQKSLEASQISDCSVEIIDIRYLFPLDFDLIKTSVMKTNKLIVVHEDNINNGFGAEIVSRVADTCFEYLDAPIKRVASKDFPVAYSSVLEDEILVQTDWIVSAINELVKNIDMKQLFKFLRLKLISTNIVILKKIGDLECLLKLLCPKWENLLLRVL